MLAVLNKEIVLFFSSLIAYVTVGTFLVVTALFLWVFPDTAILDYGYAGLDIFFDLVPRMFMFLIPAITMRSLAEERKEGTFELLATRPLTDWQIVTAKFLACILIILTSLVPTLFWYFSVYQLGAPKGNIDSGAVLGSYAGLFLLGASFASAGIFASSITRHQITAFIIAVFLCFFTYDGFSLLSRLISLQAMDVFIASLGISEHYQSVNRGVLDLRDIIYFFSFIAFFLVLTKTALGGRKW